MPAEISNNGGVIQIEWTRPWYAPLFSLILIGPALYLAYNVVAALRDDFSGAALWRDDVPGMLVFGALAVVLFVPGFMLATFRYRIDVDKLKGLVTVVRQFGPLKFRSPSKLSAYHLLTVTRNIDDSSDTPGSHEARPAGLLEVRAVKITSTFRVNLCGKGKTRPIVLAGFPERDPASAFAKLASAALGYDIKDLTGDEPDDPDLVDAR